MQQHEEFTFHISTFCNCGWLMIQRESVFYCNNSECLHYGKLFEAIVTLHQKETTRQ